MERALKLVEQTIAAGGTPGAVVAVMHQGQLVAHQALGDRTTVPAPSPMALETLFDLASLTKVMATLPAILVLLERGAIRLDDPVKRFFDWFPSEDVRVRHLLTHTGGLAPFDTSIEAPGSREERVARIGKLPLQAKPGEQVIYSDLGFILLGELVTKVDGRPLDEFVKAEVLQPLGLETAGYNPPKALAEVAAATEYRERLGRHQCGQVHDERATALGGVAGHAGLFGTALEVAKYGQSWLDASLFSRATIDLATRDLTPQVPGEDHRGLGWIVTGPTTAFSSGGDLLSPGSFGHTGFTGTSLWVDPKQQLVIALLTNRVHFGRDRNDLIRLRPLFANAVVKALV